LHIGAKASADGERATVLQPYDEPAAGLKLEPGDAVSIDEHRTMNMQEAIRALGGEALERLADEMAAFAGVELQVVSGCLHPVDVARRQLERGGWRRRLDWLAPRLGVSALLAFPGDHAHIAPHRQGESGHHG